MISSSFIQENPKKTRKFKTLIQTMAEFFIATFVI
jgi:hypothetical protein